MAGFEAATAVLPRPGAGEYAARLDPAWGIADKPNGGYLLAVLARAAVAAADGAHPHPLAVSAHYLRAPSAGDAVVTVEVLRTGRSASQVRARLDQGGHACVEALLTLGRLGTQTEPWYDDAPPVALPPEQDCPRMPVRPPGGQFDVHLMGVVEERLDPAVLGFAVGQPNGRAELRGWARLADGSDWDPLGLLVAVDALPPATFPLGSLGWVPTLELTAYVRSVPAPGPLRIRQQARLVQDGRVDEACDVWDSRGRLVAQATQLAGVRVPERPPTG